MAFLRREKVQASTPSAGQIIVLRIRANGYNFDLQDREYQFIDALGEKMLAAGLKPEEMCLERMSNGTFNVFYGKRIYVGKLCLRKMPDKWAIKRPGALRATKIFDEESSAIEYLAEKKGYEIECRKGETTTYIQYIKGLYTVKDLYCSTLEECIEVIPHWIKYIIKQNAAINKALTP